MVEVEQSCTSSEFNRPLRSMPVFVGRSRVLRDLRDQIELVGQSDAPVLIEGETGSGKDLVAQLLHCVGPRKHGPFVVVNAPTLRKHLFETELFGHVKGAFSDAANDHVGLARSADGGVLFLDEIGELTDIAQSKLLRFLDQREVRPVGGTESFPVDARIVCATNRDLMQEMERGTFRQDLYYRLRVLSLRVPSLRERPDDVPLLVEHFLERFGRELGKRPRTVAQGAMECLAGYSWPGNVRELANEVKRLVVLSENGSTVTEDFLSPHLISGPGPRPGVSARTLKQRSKTKVREMLIEALKRNGWNVSATARELDISRVGLSKKIRRMGIERPRQHRT